MTVTIDGSQGEGGGQIFRLSIALSALTGEDVVIENIRKGRPKPGLARQHLSGLLAAAQVCEADIDGAEVGATRVVFRPGDLRGGRVQVDIGTAGAITLVLQTLTPLAVQAKEPTEARLTGGTDVAWSPPADYFRGVFLPALQEMGASAELEVERRGFYPKGGGRATFRCEPAALQGLALEAPSGSPQIDVSSIATENLRNPRVAERQVEGFQQDLRRDVEARVEYVSSPSTGSVLNAVVAFPGTRLGANALGKKGRPAEEVGRMAARELRQDLDAGATVDVHLADQLLLYAAVAKGPTTMRVREVTNHAATVLDLLPRFLDAEFDLQVEDGTTRITCGGA